LPAPSIPEKLTSTGRRFPDGSVMERVNDGRSARL
jgi:hypothetical protein